MTEQCNRQQKLAITHNYDEGPILVLAGAGSGKTFVLANRLVYLAQSGIDSATIIALTFTEAAAKEMSQRIAAKLGRKKRFKGFKALPTICTFHSLGYRIIREKVNHEPNWLKIGFINPPKVLSDAKKFRILAKIKKITPKESPPPFNILNQKLLHLN